jgi:hypothetical protein
MEGLTPSQKGAVAELAFAYQAFKLGFHVYRPMADGGRCDLILELGPRLLRVQCKLGIRINDVVNIRTVTSCRAPGGGYIRRGYAAHEIDAVGAYCPDVDKCYLIPMSLAANRTQIYLRLSPAKNRQRVGIHLAEQYELGAIAQLGERQSGTLEAAGSSPASST